MVGPGSGAAKSVNESVIGPVVRQLAAYNAHDLERFAVEYADDVRVYRLPDTEPVLVGKAAFRAFYRDHRITLTGLYAEVLNRMVVGTRVVDHERVTGLGPQPSEVVAAYEVEGGLIRCVWFL